MSEQDFHFVAMLGSLRRASFTRVLAHSLDELAPDDVAVRVLPCIGEFPHYSQDVEDLAFPKAVLATGEKIAAADGLVIVTPEHNRSMPGVLKNALDWLSRLPSQPLRRKPVAIQTASPGRLGGARCETMVRCVLTSLDALTLNKPEVIIGRIADKIDVEQSIVLDESTRRVISQQLEALALLARPMARPA